MTTTNEMMINMILASSSSADEKSKLIAAILKQIEAPRHTSEAYTVCNVFFAVVLGKQTQ